MQEQSLSRCWKRWFCFCKSLIFNVICRSVPICFLLFSRPTSQYRAFNTLIIRYEQNEGTEFEPLLETVVLILQIFGECSLYS